MHAPASHTALPVHMLPAPQPVPSGSAACVHPASGSQASSEQAFRSSQSGAGASVQTPRVQVAVPLQTVPSSQEVPSGCSDVLAAHEEVATILAAGVVVDAVEVAGTGGDEGRGEARVARGCGDRVVAEAAIRPRREEVGGTVERLRRGRAERERRPHDGGANEGRGGGGRAGDERQSRRDRGEGERDGLGVEAYARAVGEPAGVGRRQLELEMGGIVAGIGRRGTTRCDAGRGRGRLDRAGVGAVRGRGAST